MKLKYYKKRKFGTFVTLLIILSFIIGPILLFGVFSSAVDIQEGDMFPEEGELIYLNVPYLYQGTFYDADAVTFAFSTAQIEFVYDPTAYSPLLYNYPVTSDFTNSESQQPFDETNVTMTNGEYFNTTEMQVDDDIYAGYNYTGIGEYRATYSFTDELDGVINNDIEGLTGFSGTDTNAVVTIVGSQGNHKKVIKVSGDGDNGAQTTIYTESVTQTSGTIEYWTKYIDNGVGTLAFYFYSTANQIMLYSYLDCSNNRYTVQYGNGAGGVTSVHTALASDTWLHVRWEFDSTTDTNSMWLDGVNIFANEEFYNDLDATSFKRIWFRTRNNAGVNAVEYYIDAIGYSWDNDYMIGWNREEYAFFGDYNSTYSFEDDLIGANPSGWVVDEGGGTVNVIGSVGNHKKVVELDDTDGGDNVRITQTFIGGAQTSGIVELWLRSDDVSDYIYLYLYAGGPYVLYMQAVAAGWRVYYGGGWNVLATSADNVWYHIRVYWRDDAGTTKITVWLDGIEIVSDEPAPNNGSITSMAVSSLAGGTNTIYVDAIDYSWSPGYSNGRNRLTENDDILGHYPATHSFPFDNVGEAPEGWDSAAYTVIGSAWQEHRK
ncbi:hypothetical protein LCGC14_0770350, partial [marine sediment metagenome]